MICNRHAAVLVVLIWRSLRGRCTPSTAWRIWLRTLRCRKRRTTYQEAVKPAQRARTRAREDADAAFIAARNAARASERKAWEQADAVQERKIHAAMDAV